MNCTKYSYFKPTLGHCWVIALVFIIGNVGISLILAMLGLAQLATKYTSLAYVLTAIIPLVYIFFMSKNASQSPFLTPAPLNRPNYGRLNKILFFVLLLFAPSAMGIIIDPLTALMPMPDAMKAIFENLYLGTPLWDTILATSIMAPLFEEFLCRGIILRGMLENNMAPWKAIVWSSLIFAVIHMNPWQGVAAFALALFFGWVYYRTRNLWACVFLHFVNNFTSIMIARIFPDMDVDEALCQSMPPMQFIMLFVIAAIVVAGIIYVLNKNLEKKAFGNEENTKETISA